MATPPRQIIPGATWFVTRRITQRAFLLKPSLAVNAILGYLLAWAAAKNRIRLHAFCFLSNHYHAIFTDPEGNASQFLQDFHSFSARALNAHLGRWENLWSSDDPSLVRLVEPGDVFAKIVYTICNPVSSFLVRFARDWPGLRSGPEDLATTRVFERPDAFFRAEGPMPERMELRIELPGGEDGGEELDEYRAELAKAVLAREAECQAEVERTGRAFLGVRAVLAQSREARPKTIERKRELSPAIACKRKARRILEIQRWKEFVKDYHEALREFIRGDHEVFFPFGTYRMVRTYRLRCLSPPEDLAFA